MTTGVVKKRIPENHQRDPQEVALDRAVSELFHEFGLVIPAKPQIGMTNVKPADPATFTERITAVLQQYGININKELVNQITGIQATINSGNRQAILPTPTPLKPGEKAMGESYGREFIKILQAANTQN